MAAIKEVMAREILDSRGSPTVEADLRLSDGHSARASVPSGASKGIHEAIELRDGGKRYLGKGVLKAVSNVENVGKKIKGINVVEQSKFDNYLISLAGENKAKLGANAVLALSMAYCRAGAIDKNIKLYGHIAELFHAQKAKLSGMPKIRSIFEQSKNFIMPTPFMNIINGGKHAGNNLNFQEFMIVPNKAKSFREALRIGSEVYGTLKEIIVKKYGKSGVNVGDEGGFAPNIVRKEDALDLVMDAVNSLGYKNSVKLALDCAASEFYSNGSYFLEGKIIDVNGMIQVYKDLVKDYPIISIEDPFQQEDFSAFAALKRELRDKIQIIGDDLTVTNPERIRKAAMHQSCNCLLLKVNQIGTITEALNAARTAMENKWNVMVSHRSGETEDSFIADLAVGISSGMIKAGAPCRGERLAKYNQLLRIEEELGGKAKYGKQII